MREIMMNFNVEKLDSKIAQAHLTRAEVSKRIGRSDAFLYVPMKTGRIKRSDFYKIDHVLTSLIENNHKDPIQLEPEIINVDVVTNEEVSTDDAIAKMTDDVKLVHELGYQKICRLYELASYEKKYGFIKEDQENETV